MISKTLLILIAAASLYAAETPAPPKSPTANPGRSVHVTEKTAPAIHSAVYQSTLIVLPEEEKITAVFEGDKENWHVETTKVPTRFLSVKPTAKNVATDLHIVSDHGNSYSFTLTETSDTEPTYDSKIFVEPGDGPMKRNLDNQPLFVPASDLDRYKQEAEAATRKAQEEIDRQKAASEKQAQEFRSQYPAHLNFHYRWDAKSGKQFGVEQIFCDDKFTYIKANPQETPALYEVKDGKPSLITYDFAHGLYTAPKILTDGYLAVGKVKMPFHRESSR